MCVHRHQYQWSVICADECIHPKQLFFCLCTLDVISQVYKWHEEHDQLSLNPMSFLYSDYQPVQNQLNGHEHTPTPHNNFHISDESVSSSQRRQSISKFISV